MSLPIYQRVAVTDAGDVIPGAEYTVINENTGVAAPIYSDRTGATLLTAPYFADSAGTIQFFIAQGTTFRVAASGGVGTYTDRYVYGVSAAVLALADGSASINRVGSDGSALSIQKDGTTVGSIGSYTGDNLTIGTGAVGVRFDSGLNTLIPHNVSTNANQDATTDLGYSTVRFKDLHLSGGVYLGGTAATNKLDDYEEGTFTPMLTFGGSSSGLSAQTNAGEYTKVGNLVTGSIRITLTSKGSSVGGATITGLPFQSKSGNGTFGVGNPAYANNFVNEKMGNSINLVGGNGTTIDFRAVTSSGQASTITNSDFNNNSDMIIRFSYHTN